MSKQQGNKNGTFTEKPKNNQGYQRLPQNEPLTQVKPKPNNTHNSKPKHAKQGPPKPTRIGNDNDDEKWRCPGCTFKMSNILFECTMCGEPRPQ